MGTSIGSRRIGVIHVPFTAATGAHSTGRRCTERAALDNLTASRAAFATPSRVISLVAANPHEPFTRVRTPTPYDSLSATPLTERSRVLIFWRRYRPTRASA